MEEKLKKKIKKMIKDKKEVSGKIKSIEFNSVINKECLNIELDKIENLKVVIPSEEFSLENINAEAFINEVVTFRAVELIDEIVVCSRKIIKLEERNAFVEKIFSGEEIIANAKMVKFNHHINERSLYLEVEGIEAIDMFIPESELDFNNLSITKFIGGTVKVKFIEKLENGEYMFSRKLAQEKTRKDIIERLENGEVIAATINNFVQHGAYMNIDGIQALLKHPDFASDCTRIEEVHKVGDKINVELVKINKNGKIQLKAVELFSRPSNITFDTLEIEELYSGRLRSIKPDFCFVCIAPGIDVLCSIPQADFIAEEGMRVTVALKKIIDPVLDQEGNVIEKGKVRGIILRIFQTENDVIND